MLRIPYSLVRSKRVSITPRIGFTKSYLSRLRSAQCQCVFYCRLVCLQGQWKLGNSALEVGSSRLLRYRMAFKVNGRTPWQIWQEITEGPVSFPVSSDLPNAWHKGSPGLHICDQCPSLW